MCVCPMHEHNVNRKSGDSLLGSGDEEEEDCGVEEDDEVGLWVAYLVNTLMRVSSVARRSKE